MIPSITSSAVAGCIRTSTHQGGSSDPAAVHWLAIRLEANSLRSPLAFPVLAALKQAAPVSRCPLFGADRKAGLQKFIAAFDPKRMATSNTG
jgi:hypothetical protein